MFELWKDDAGYRNKIDLFVSKERIGLSCWEKYFQDSDEECLCFYSVQVLDEKQGSVELEVGRALLLVIDEYATKPYGAAYTALECYEVCTEQGRLW